MPVAGNHHDSFELEQQFDKMLNDLHASTIRTDGLFLNADAGFDTTDFRTLCEQREITANIAYNPRNGSREILI